MKTHDLKNFDQSDAFTLSAQLSLHAAYLRGLIHTSSGKLINPPELEKGDDVTNIKILEGHCTELETRLGGNAPTFNFTGVVIQRGAGEAARHAPGFNPH
jgi:hypothetical protein